MELASELATERRRVSYLRSQATAAREATPTMSVEVTPPSSLATPTDTTMASSTETTPTSGSDVARGGVDKGEAEEEKEGVEDLLAEGRNAGGNTLSALLDERLQQINVRNVCNNYY